MKTICLYSMILLSGVLLPSGCNSSDKTYHVDLKLEIPGEEIIRSVASPYFSGDPVFKETLRLTRQLKENSTDRYPELFIKAFETNNPGGTAVQFFMTPETRDLIDFNTTNSKVTEFLETRFEEIVTGSSEVFKSRLVNFGISLKNLQIETNGNRMHYSFIVKSDITEDLLSERIIRLFTIPGKLEFWETYQLSEIRDYLKTVDSIFHEMQKTQGSSGGHDEVGSSQLAELPLFDVINPYTDQNGNIKTGAVIGIVYLKDIVTVNEILSEREVIKLLPRDLKFAWQNLPESAEDDYIQLFALKTIVSGSPALDGSYLINASAEIDDYTGDPVVNISMNARGAVRWANITRENIGRQIAITLDDKVLTAPVVQEQIIGGRANISGNFTMEEASDLASLLKSSKGGLPGKPVIEDFEIVEKN